jgi:hypothetical protein
VFARLADYLQPGQARELVLRGPTFDGFSNRLGATRFILHLVLRIFTSFHSFLTLYIVVE